jgi:cell division control protein 7
MARQKGVRVARIAIHEDAPDEPEDRASDVDEYEHDAASGSDMSVDPESEVDDSVAEDIERFHLTFKGLTDRYRLIGRIGEGVYSSLVSDSLAHMHIIGTFSTVYKAEDLKYDQYNNQWDSQNLENSPWRKHKRTKSRGPRYVAIKKIYVTSSPVRVLNELEILHDLKHSENVCPLITSFRHNDQVIAILPYFQHQDFRDYFRDMTVADMRLYFRSLFTALAGVHKKEVLHRDIKPTNFLYNPQLNHGVLVDFGLAERQGTDYQHCNCLENTPDRRWCIENSAWGSGTYNELYKTPCYPKPDRDTRASKRANRAGTRGFRAPEVLLKCTAQSTAIDIWSAGVILLTLLARRFPFFHSTDDIDALLELTHIFGKVKMREAALLHGQVMKTNIPTYSESGHSLEKIILWSTSRHGKDEYGNRLFDLTKDEKEAVGFLALCLELDPAKRITAEKALRHPFIASAGLGLGDDDEMDLLETVSDE